jgi:hypothetical protein
MRNSYHKVGMLQCLYYMISARDKMFDSITSRIIQFFYQNKLASEQNKNDGAVSAEDFIKELFNLLYEGGDSNYVCTSKIRHNYPGIDIINKVKKQGVQVTVREDNQKIKDTFKKIPTIGENSDYNKVIFVIQSSHKPKNLLKQPNLYQGYSLEIKSASEILNDISNLGDNALEKVCAYVEKAVVIPDPVSMGRNVDAEIFFVLFDALINSLESDPSDIPDHDDLIYKTSIEEKRKKFSDFWKILQQLYKDSLGLKEDGSTSNKLIFYRKYVEEAFSQRLNETQKETIQSYLKTQSAMLLHQNDGDPVKAINQMVSVMQDELKLGFLNKANIISFLLNMFFKCDVFPMIDESYDE